MFDRRMWRLQLIVLHELHSTFIEVYGVFLDMILYDFVDVQLVSKRGLKCECKVTSVYHNILYEVTNCYAYVKINQSNSMELSLNQSLAFDQLQVLVIEFVLLAIDFVLLANKFVQLLAIEFITLAFEFVTLALWQLTSSRWKMYLSCWQMNLSSWLLNSSLWHFGRKFVCNKIGSWSKHENKMQQLCNHLAQVQLM